MSRNYCNILDWRLRPWVCLFILLLITLVIADAAHGQTLTGFTLPFRTIELASDEPGVLFELHVDEGAEVRQGDLICKLDDRLQAIQAELTLHQMQSNCDVDAAREALAKREKIHARIQELRKNGHASEAELIRSELELAIAQTRLVAAREQVVSREIEHRRATIVLERRKIHAPFAGKIAEVHKFQGEFVSPMHPKIVTLVQTDVLLAVFNILPTTSKDFAKGQVVSVSFEDGLVVEGEIYCVGVGFDAESGTQQLKVRLDNADGKLKSGQQCKLLY
ncbi:MAG TPA: efflux RND transporter periplasmic adaptor subunit [Pirellulaceae bacterium]|nr:efflux RND transporter periplasmic adaptor subunit [Pirellulaceae bacterium]HMO91770.1 efflux RND transporter periplasmic adaptor subunit [Pirellulaceae bacterium]HMP69569.1 efflux RND transporter periplasmic adaptor subunit [Pirellulaceae bacterium]